MQARALGILMAVTVSATAQSTPPPKVSLNDLRSLLDDPKGDLSRIAKQAIGSNGGNRLFYFPTRDEPTTPTDWGLKYDAVNFKSADGTALHGWLMHAKGKSPATANGTIVFSHGNAGSMSYHLGFCAWLAEAGYNVLLYDYRGFGKSGGTVERRGMIDDVKAAFAYARTRRDLDTDRLVSFGHSLGGAQSVTALGEDHIQGVRAIIIDGAFASYRAMARVIGGQLGESLVSDELAPKDFVKKLPPVPFLVVHGDRDEIVPVSQGLQLYEAANQPKTLFQVKTGQHGTSLSGNEGAYRKKLIAWLDAVLNG